MCLHDFFCLYILEAKYSVKVTKSLHKKKIPTASEFDFKKTIKLMSSAKNPLVLLGGGALEAYDVVYKFIEKTGIPVVSTLMGVGAFPSASERYLGMIGINGSFSANTALNNADFILSFVY